MFGARLYKRFIPFPYWNFIAYPIKKPSSDSYEKDESCCSRGPTFFNDTLRYHPQRVQSYSCTITGARFRSRLVAKCFTDQLKDVFFLSSLCIFTNHTLSVRGTTEVLFLLYAFSCYFL